MTNYPTIHNVILYHICSQSLKEDERVSANTMKKAHTHTWKHHHVRETRVRELHKGSEAEREREREREKRRNDKLNIL